MEECASRTKLGRGRRDLAVALAPGFAEVAVFYRGRAVHRGRKMFIAPREEEEPR